MPKKLIKSFRYASLGARHAVKTQRNLWIHFFIALAVMLTAALLKFNYLEKAILILTVFVVIVAEMFNTAVEEMVNMLSPHHQVQAGVVKNIAAASVLLAAIGAVMVGLILFMPKVVGLIK